MAKAKECKFDLDYSRPFEVDELSGDDALVYLWCETHKCWEWVWQDIDDIGLR